MPGSIPASFGRIEDRAVGVSPCVIRNRDCCKAPTAGNSKSDFAEGYDSHISDLGYGMLFVPVVA